MDRPQDLPIAIIGAGPAGLTAAYELVKRGDKVIVFEADRVVGGISRTVERDGKVVKLMPGFGDLLLREDPPSTDKP